MTKHKHSKKNYIQFITQYGIHIWAILIIANAVMVYAYQFSTHAASKQDTSLQALDVSTTPSLSVSVSPSPSPENSQPLGPAINLQFSVPGIGSGGGTMKPLHPKRNVTIYLYSPDVNSMNPSVKPLYTIKSFAIFDSNQYNPTYTSFLNPLIDLGSDVKDGNYQIAFSTDLSLRTLIKQNPGDLGGEIFGLSKTVQMTIPPQTVLMGDTIPTGGGNNIIDINDYNAFVTCYGNANNTNSFCKTGNYGDFNDDGVINGLDYNILARSLYALSQEGIAVPELTPSPTPNEINKLIHQVTPSVAKKKTIPAKAPLPKTSQTIGKGGSPLGVIFLILFLVVAGVMGFKFRSKIMSLIHLSPTGTPSTDTTGNAEATPEQADGIVQTEETQTDTPAQSDTGEDQDSEELSETMPATDQQEAALPAAAEPSKAGDTLEKDCYIKTKGNDDAGTGMWLLLTDDFGAMNAHYSKADAKDGFAKVKGVMKEEDGKKFLEISELTMEG